MDAAVFIKTVLADDLAREAENYSVSDFKSTRWFFHRLIFRFF